MSIPFIKWTSRWESSFLEVFIFVLISKGPQYGKQLVDMAKSSISDKIKIPTVYAILNRARDQGLLADFTPSKKNATTRGKDRRYYKLTPTGKEFLDMVLKRVDETYTVLNTIQERKTIEEEIF